MKISLSFARLDPAPFVVFGIVVGMFSAFALAFSVGSFVTAATGSPACGLGASSLVGFAMAAGLFWVVREIEKAKQVQRVADRLER